MSLNKNEEYLWTEKYRPRTIDDCVLAPELKKTLSDIVKKNNIPTLLLTGKPGTGKTTAARALCNELDLDYLFINGSKDGGIGTLRNEIEQFASSVSLAGGDKPKVVILDESDYLPIGTQTALRGFIEEFSSNCRFIFTCNFRNRILDPIQSRCTVLDFNSSKKSLAKLAGAFLTKLKIVLNKENVTYDERVLAEVIMKFAPDWRRVINECQRYGLSGAIDTGLLSVINHNTMDLLVTHLKEKNFREMRKWVVNNVDLESATIFRMIYDSMSDYMDPSSIPQTVLTLAEYQYKASFVADSEINIVACLTELMVGTTWLKRK